jgi:deoxyribodipyrimidine photolyase-related protein
LKKVSEAAIIFPNQLFKINPILKPNRQVYLVEEFLFFSQYKFHKQKLLLHRISMKSYEQFLIEEKYKVKYIESIEKNHDIRIFLKEIKEEYSDFYFILPVDNYLEQRINKELQGKNIFFHENPNFLNEDSVIQLETKKKKYNQTDFYKKSRLKLNILIEKDGKPTGGKWSFDSENRKKLPEREICPSLPSVKKSKFEDEAKKYIERNFSDNPGSIENFIYPTDFEGTKVWLENFIQYRFEKFGIYEDAISTKEPYMYHSILSPLINIGLFNPDELIREILLKSKKIPLNSIEGFIRQIIGWREFIRLVYVKEGSRERTTNFWKFNKKIPNSFYTGETGIEPVDFVIKKVLETGYCHHIERLMILGNFFVLCEFHPDEVYRWFMELFIDAYDWVMVPNIYGMSQFADGGIMSTKPYISGSNYIKKMSDFKDGEWVKIWDGLFWRFLSKQNIFFAKNPRLSMLLKTWEKMNEDKKNIHLRNADLFLKKLEELK